MLSQGDLLEDFIFCPELVAKAEAGDPISQYKLAGFYDRGEGVVLDKKQAINWYRKSVDQGNEKALAPLFDCFYSILQNQILPRRFKDFETSRPRVTRGHSIFLVCATLMEKG